MEVVRKRDSPGDSVNGAQPANHPTRSELVLYIVTRRSMMGR